MTCKEDRARVRECFEGATIQVHSHMNSQHRIYPELQTTTPGIGLDAELSIVATGMVEDLLCVDTLTPEGLAQWLRANLAVAFTAGAEFERLGHFAKLSAECTCADEP